MPGYAAGREVPIVVGRRQLCKRLAAQSAVGTLRRCPALPTPARSPKRSCWATLWPVSGPRHCHSAEQEDRMGRPQREGQERPQRRRADPSRVSQGLGTLRNVVNAFHPMRPLRSCQKTTSHSWRIAPPGRAGLDAATFQEPRPPGRGYQQTQKTGTCSYTSPKRPESNGLARPLSDRSKRSADRRPSSTPSSSSAAAGRAGRRP